MAGGGISKGSAPVHAADYHGKLNFYVCVVVLVAASGGLLFGYDIGVTGGVESMASFQKKFFPDVYERTESGASSDSPYCVYSDHLLALFTSSLFLAGMFISLPASYVTRKYGRKITMIFAGACFLLGSALNAAAQNLAYLIVGRVFLGFGIGSANVVVPLYLSEQAPYKLRGALNQMFQLAVTIGILTAQLINYGTQEWEEGWRLSLGLAGVPAVILLLGGIFLPESPNSLIERGQDAKGRAILEKLRGTTEVDAEYDDIKEAVFQASQVSSAQSWRAQFTKPYLPALILTVGIAMLQQFTGINAIMFYVPVLFSTLGSGRSAALLNTVIIGAVNVVATFVAIFSVDKVGRRKLFLWGGVQMVVALATTGILIGVEFGKYGTDLPKGSAIGILIVICVFVSAFAYSWGPLGWLVPSELQTLETRAAGMSSAVVINFLFSFVIGQAFLSMLCAMRWGVFLFFAAWGVLMTIFIYFLLPETKGVPIENVQGLFATHKVWKKVMGSAADDVLAKEASQAHSRKAAAASNGQFSIKGGSDKSLSGSDN